MSRARRIVVGSRRWAAWSIVLVAVACNRADAPNVGHTGPAGPAAADAGTPSAAMASMGGATGHQHSAGSVPASANAAAIAHGQVHPGTMTMAVRLKAMADRMGPDSGPYDNGLLLGALRASGPPADPSQQFDYFFNVALQQLNGGALDDAIASFKQIQGLMRAHGASLSDTPQLRRVTSMLSITWLRKGEVQNCAINHNADSCFFPLKGGGVHRDPSAVEMAIPELEALARSDPKDLSARWLLNIAHMARGTYPDGVPEPLRIDPGVFASTDNIGRFLDVAPALGLDVTGRAGGVIIDDFSGDGNLDVMVSTWGPYDELHYFVSRGDGTFEDRTAAAGLTGLTGGLNMVQADFDGDGWLDFLVLRGAWRRGRTMFPNSLVRNRGDGTFEDVTEAAGMLSYHPTQTGAWADYDGDGDLDLFVGNETGSDGFEHPNELWRNAGDGTFTDVAHAAGVDVGGYTKGVSWGDYDDDGRPDLYLSRLGLTNVLLHNDGPGPGDTWTFSDVTVAAGVGEPVMSFPTWWWDYDDDGRLDLLVSGYGNYGLEDRVSAAGDVLADYLGLPTNGTRLHLYHNQGDGTFANVAHAAKVDGILLTMGSNFGDLDNDGWEDFYLGTGNPDLRTLVPNRMFRNAGDGTFHDITTSGGFGNLQKGHAISFADLDNDGDQDVYADMGGAFEADWYPNILFENPGHPPNHWATLRLVGPGANRSAIGARVTVRVATPGGTRTLHRLVGSGGSFGANSLQVELGLGDATGVEDVRVAWPGGETEVFTGVGLDAVWKLSAGDPLAQPVAQPSFRLGGEPFGPAAAQP